MDRRVEFHEKLCDVMRQLNLQPYVYYQPPESVKMKYPCIRYSLEDIDIVHADDISYTKPRCYSVTVIDRNPDSLIPDALCDLKYSSFSRHYAAENLHHFSFRIYY